MSAGGSRTSTASPRCQTRLSGPLLDGIDLVIEVPAVTAADLILPPPTEGSAEVALRVAAARRNAQTSRYAALGLDGITTNASCPAPLLEEVANPDSDGMALIRDAAEAMRLSARGFHGVWRSPEPWPTSIRRNGSGGFTSPKRSRIEPTTTGVPSRPDGADAQPGGAW